MNILPFQLNVPAEVVLANPQGTLVQGRYSDRIMFNLADGRIMYVPPFVAALIDSEGISAGERIQLCKSQIQRGHRRSIEWIVKRLGPVRPCADATAPGVETQLERDLRASIDAVNGKIEAVNGNNPATEHSPEIIAPPAGAVASVPANGAAGAQNGVPSPNGHATAPTKLEHALKTAISAAYNAEKYGAELGYVVRFDADAIKSMAITVLINMSEGSRRWSTQS
jgi:hypothetical protein